MLEKLDNQALAMIYSAIDMARRFGHESVTMDHLLLAMSSMDTSMGQTFRLSGLKPDEIRDQIEKTYGSNKERLPESGSSVPFSPEVDELLTQLAIRASAVGANGQVSLLEFASALLVPGQCVVREILYGVKAGEDRPESIEHMVSPPEAPAAATSSSPSESSTGAESTYDLSIEMPEGDFSAAANFAMLFARIEAATFSFASRKINSTSILVGLTLEQGGWGGKLLRKAGVGAMQVRGAASQAIAGRLIPSDLECLLFDSNCRRLLQMARKKCRLQKHEFVSTVHILWAILSGGDSRAKAILSDLISDLASFKNEVNTCLLHRYDGNGEELRVDEELYRTLISGASIPPRFYGLPPRAETGSTYEAGNFDLRHLDPVSLSIMEGAIAEYSKHGFAQFQAKHVFFALLEDGRSAAAKYLHAWGVTAKLIRSKAALSAVPIPKSLGPGGLDASVAELLVSSMVCARHFGCSKIAPEHMFLAMLLSENKGLKWVIDGLHLDLMRVQSDAEALCRDHDFKYSIFSSKFARIASFGLLIYGVVCEPVVGLAVQTALEKAEECGSSVVDGRYLIYGLLYTSSYAATLLRSLEIDFDFAAKFSAADKCPVQKKSKAAKKKSAPKPAAAAEPKNIVFEPSLEDAFYKGLERSLTFKAAAVSAEHLLYGLLESQNAQVLQLLSSNNSDAADLLTNLREYLDFDLSGSQRLRSILDRISALSVNLSPSVEKALHYAASMSLDMQTDIIGPELMIYSLMCCENEPASQMLFECGLDVPTLKQALLNTAQYRMRSDEIFMTVETLAIFSQAAKFASSFDAEQVDCNHIVMAILDAGIARESVFPGVAINRLELLLYGTVEITERASKLEFGTNLRRKMRVISRSGRTMMINAAIIAVESGRNFLDCEHVLYAMADCSNKDLRMFLLDNGLSKARVEEIAGKYISRVVEFTSAPLTLSEALEVQLDWAYSKAVGLRTGGGVEISVELLLLAMLKMPSGITSAIFADLNIERTLFARSLEDFITRQLSRHGDLERERIVEVLSSQVLPIKSSASTANLVDSAASWYHRASMAHGMGRRDLAIEALMHWWQYRKKVTERQGLSAPEPPNTPEFYFGPAIKTAQPDFGTAKDSPGPAKDPATVWPKTSAGKPDPYDRLPIFIDNTLIAAETNLIIGRSYNLAAKYIFAPEPPAEFVRPIHLLLATVNAPEYADLIFGTNAQKGLPALIDAVRSRCLPSDVGATANSEVSMELSDNSKAVLVAAFNQSRTFSGSQLSLRPEHLLLALLDHDPWTVELLTEIGFEAKTAKKAILWYIDIRGR